jgi:hypothetical protein
MLRIDAPPIPRTKRVAPPLVSEKNLDLTAGRSGTMLPT